MSNDEKELRLTIQAQFERDTRSDAFRQMFDEIKSSVATQYTSEELIQAAPTSLIAISSCLVASGSRDARQMKLEGQFPHLRSELLAANLMECGDLGRKAFLTAETNMDFLKMVSAKISNSASDAIEMLNDPPSTRKILKTQLSQINRFADNGYDKAREIDQRFEEWLVFASELHAACIKKQSTEQERAQATERDAAVAKARFSSGAQNEAAKKAMDSFAKQVNLALEGFKKASDGATDGNDLIGQQIVSGLADSVSAATAQLITSYASTLSPVTGASSSDRLNRDDPAYSEIKRSAIYFDLLNAILTKGGDGGVNWDTAKGAYGISFTLQRLSEAQTSFGALAADTKPSKTLKIVLEDAVQTAKSLQTELNKSKDFGSFPTSDSDTVKSWQKVNKTAYLSVQQLLATARTLPGLVPGGAPLMANLNDPPAILGNTNIKSAQAQAALDSVKNRFATTQKYLQQTRDLHAEASKVLTEKQSKLNAISSQLSNLSNSRLGLEEIKVIVARTVELIIEVKTQIMNLCRFYKALGAAVGDVVKYTVGPLIDSINDGSGGKTLGGYTFQDLARSITFQSILEIHGFFGVFAAVASMWTLLSRESLMPGLQLLDQVAMMIEDSNMASRFASNLKRWSEEAQSRLGRTLAERRAKVERSISENIEDIERTTRELSVVSEIQRAIDDGANEVRAAGLEIVAQKISESALK